MAERRPNARIALGRVLTSRDRADAEERMRVLLSRAWAAGHDAGWRDGVSDATDDEPTRTPNPYRLDVPQR